MQRMSDTLTFRDFAGALMGNDAAKAAEVLAVLLGLDAAAAQAATEHFFAQMKADPSFMMKAMSMRTAVESKDAAAVAKLIGDCFALEPARANQAATALLARY